MWVGGGGHFEFPDQTHQPYGENIKMCLISNIREQTWKIFPETKFWLEFKEQLFLLKNRFLFMPVVS